MSPHNASMGRVPSHRSELSHPRLDYFVDRFGPLVTARQMLGDRFGELRAEILAIWDEQNEADDGRLVLPQEYLLSVIRL